jgi:hypothetical protein
MVGYTVNSQNTMKSVFYSEFYLEKITNLIKTVPLGLFLVVSPFYSLWLGLYGIIAYRAKLYSLKLKNKKNEKRIKQLYKD